ncbi:Putative amino-acid ABC transporter-binding protein YhdW [Seminavis robusta]|uniref:Amino-acid ABC transporter-binding protein YhdW n=1 Tax=Seminavis robusta TaxID=568900 RepID=A0A9N8HFT9_9STRA|nr:Putative amino-acid ABC transporter-binding protein YhdW [Seminavis robusta]|eukprot:Sro474_g150180.1 Putative amino-acid ABC transporter-binding protein YhdW (912) ;mRNA; r:8616-11748
MNDPKAINEAAADPKGAEPSMMHENLAVNDNAEVSLLQEEEVGDGVPSFDEQELSSSSRCQEEHSERQAVEDIGSEAQVCSTPQQVLYEIDNRIDRKLGEQQQQHSECIASPASSTTVAMAAASESKSAAAAAAAAAPMTRDEKASLQQAMPQEVGAFATPGPAPYNSFEIARQRRILTSALTSSANTTTSRLSTTQHEDNDTFDPEVGCNFALGAPVSAVRVDHDALEDRIRQDIIRSSTQAHVIAMEKSSSSFRTSQQQQTAKSTEDDECAGGNEKTRNQRLGPVAIVVVVLMVVVIVIVAIATLGGSSEDELAVSSDEALAGNVESPSSQEETNPEPLSTLEAKLEQIRSRRQLLCALAGHHNWRNEIVDLEWKDEYASYGGQIEADLCRAIAAAVFGKGGEDKVEIMAKRGWHKSRTQDIEMDVYVGTLSPTMEHDIYLDEAKTGYSFSVPYYYEGLRFAGLPSDVRCAEDIYASRVLDQDIDVADECMDVKVCIPEFHMHSANGTMFEGFVEKFPQSLVVSSPSNASSFDGMLLGECTVVAGYKEAISTEEAMNAGIDSNYTLGDLFVPKMPRAIVTKDDSPEWSDFVNWVLLSLASAAQQNITKASAEEMPLVPLFGDSNKASFRDAVHAVGNIDEVLMKSQPESPDTIMKHVKNDGRMIALPFGPTQATELAPLLESSTMQSILDRGTMRCAIHDARPGFADTFQDQYQGIDVDFCLAVAAALFSTDNPRQDNRIEFVAVDGQTTDGFALLARQDVDILAGAIWTLENDVQEPATGEGYSFTQPYFYRPTHSRVSLDVEVNLCLATRQDDSLWSSFASWVVASTIFAEQTSIAKESADSMPKVDLFGSPFENMFQHAVGCVGNYGEIWEANLEPLVARSGPNVLQTSPQLTMQGPRFYIPPLAA